ncbi:hypothetical protein DFP72DRAFT_872792, partial [Ephemerocybe angulata]
MVRSELDHGVEAPIQFERVQAGKRRRKGRFPVVVPEDGGLEPIIYGRNELHITHLTIAELWSDHLPEPCQRRNDQPPCSLWSLGANWPGSFNDTLGFQPFFHLRAAENKQNRNESNAPGQEIYSPIAIAFNVSTLYRRLSHQRYKGSRTRQNWKTTLLEPYLA